VSLPKKPGGFWGYLPGCLNHAVGRTTHWPVLFREILNFLFHKFTVAVCYYDFISPAVFQHVSWQCFVFAKAGLLQAATATVRANCQSIYVPLLHVLWIVL